MKSRTTDRFWKCYALLPAATKKRAKEAYKHFMKDPYHPGLHYKRVHSSRPIFSVRITVGRFSSGKRDISSKHDTYLVEAFSK